MKIPFKDIWGKGLRLLKKNQKKPKMKKKYRRGSQDPFSYVTDQPQFFSNTLYKWSDLAEKNFRLVLKARLLNVLKDSPNSLSNLRTTHLKYYIHLTSKGFLQIVKSPSICLAFRGFLMLGYKNSLRLGYKEHLYRIFVSPLKAHDGH